MWRTAWSASQLAADIAPKGITHWAKPVTARAPAPMPRRPEPAADLRLPHAGEDGPALEMLVGRRPDRGGDRPARGDRHRRGGIRIRLEEGEGDLVAHRPEGHAHRHPDPHGVGCAADDVRRQ